MTTLAAAPDPSAATADAGGYTARHLSVLEGLDAVRKRPGMYIGSTDGRGLQHCLWEIFDNSVDEALAGYCSRIEVVLHADGSAEVRDNGRGIPVDVEPKTKLTGVELVMTRLHAGGKFGNGSYTASGGLHGVGASVVNALAARLDIEVDRGGQHLGDQLPPRRHRRVHGQRRAQSRGQLHPARRPAPDPPGREEGHRHPDPVLARPPGVPARRDVQLHRHHRTRPPDGLPRAGPGHPASATSAPPPPERRPGRRAERARTERTAAPPPGPREAEFRFDGGISEFCEHLAAGEPVTDVLRLVGSGQFTETVPVLDDRGHMTPTEVERELEVDVAVRWVNGYDTATRSFVNVIATPHGGTHVSGFDRALVRTMNEQLRAARLLKNGDEPVTKEDVLEGMTAIVTVRLPEPQFEGQTKEVLGTPPASRIVAQVVAAGLQDVLRSPRPDRQAADPRPAGEGHLGRQGPGRRA